MWTHSTSYNIFCLITLTLLPISGCNSERSSTKTNPATTSGSVVVDQKPIPERLKLEAKGQNESIVIGGTARQTLLEMTAPNIWYELKNLDGSVLKVELSDKDKNAIDKNWERFSRYHAARLYSSNDNEKAQSAYDHTISAVGLTNLLRETKIKVSDKDTELTEDEISELLDVQATLMRLRLEEVIKAFPEIE